MNVHPRYQQVNSARTALSEAFNKIWDQFDLTYAEATMVIIDVLGSDVITYMLRVERHGDEVTPYNETKEG